MRLNGWMTKTPLSSCRRHSFSTAISLPYTYRDWRLSCGRSRALHPQVAVVHPTPGPLSFSMIPPSPSKAMILGSAVCGIHPPSAAAAQSYLGQVESDSSRPDLLSWSQGNFPCRLTTSGSIGAEWSEASGHPPCSLCLVSPSLPPSRSPYIPSSPPASHPLRPPRSISAPSTSFLLLPAHQLFSICVSSSHESSCAKEGRSRSYFCCRQKNMCL